MYLCVTSCICVLGVSILPLSMIVLILELLRQCGICFCFSFYVGGKDITWSLTSRETDIK